MEKIDFVGKRFYRLVVLKEVRCERINKHTFRYLLCKCDCGNEKEILSWNLTKGATKSCGCLQSDNKYKHGKSRTGAYKSWHAMITRCTKKSHPAYKSYSKLRVCKEWLDFESFYKDMGERPKGKSIDRIDGTKGYFKENCRWAGWIVQGNNRASCKSLTFDGKKMTIAEWAREKNIKYSTLKERIRRGWNIEKALTVKVR
jgi:hypothetical protein